MTEMFDFTYDGVLDGTAYDADDNGMYEVLAYDPDQDGDTNVWFTDADQNGVDDAAETAVVGPPTNRDAVAGLLLEMAERTGWAAISR